MRPLALLLPLLLLCAGCDSATTQEVPGTFSLTVSAPAGASSLRGVALAGAAADLPDAEIPGDVAGFVVVMAEGSLTQPTPGGRTLVIGWEATTPPALGPYPLGADRGSGSRALAVYYASGTEVYLATSGTVTVEAVSQRSFRGRFEMEAASTDGTAAPTQRITLQGTFSAVRASS